MQHAAIFQEIGKNKKSPSAVLCCDGQTSNKVWPIPPTGMEGVTLCRSVQLKYIDEWGAHTLSLILVGKTIFSLRGENSAAGEMSPSPEANRQPNVKRVETLVNGAKR